MNSFSLLYVMGDTKLLELDDTLNKVIKKCFQICLLEYFYIIESMIGFGVFT